jgi:hypothetical protein
MEITELKEIIKIIEDIIEDKSSAIKNEFEEELDGIKNAIAGLAITIFVACVLLALVIVKLME